MGSTQTKSDSFLSYNKIQTISASKVQLLLPEKQEILRRGQMIHRWNDAKRESSAHNKYAEPPPRTFTEC
jgi:hypothetical protein